MDNQIKILFVRSGNRGNDPISYNQGLSLRKIGLIVEFEDLIGKGITGYLKNIKKVRSRVKEFQPNIIHAHYSLCGYVVALSFPKRPIVVSLMGSDVHGVYCLGLAFVKIFAFLFWDKIIVKSNFMKRRLNIKNAHVIPNGINLEKFKLIDKKQARAYLNWDENKRYLLFSSDSDRPEKNFKLAITSLKMVENKNIEIIFLKGIDFDEMVFYYNAADLLLLTSLYEGSPNVIKEAMACNCPIVSTDVGDVREVIGNTLGCFIVDFEPKNIAMAIEKVLVSNKRTNGRLSILHLTDESIAYKLLTVYKSLL